MPDAGRCIRLPLPFSPKGKGAVSMNQRVKSFHRRWIFLVSVAVGIGIGALNARTALTQEQPAEDAGASLRSDKAAYQAGETATLTGEGFQGREPIQLDISIDEPVTGTHVADSALTPFTADANGEFIAEYVVPTAADGLMVRATAVGGSSGLSAMAILNNPAWVATDLEDYPPGALVTITGGGFHANETVELQVLHVGYVDSD